MAHFLHHSGRSGFTGPVKAPAVVPALPGVVPTTKSAEESLHPGNIKNEMRAGPQEKEAVDEYDMDRAEVYRCGNILGVRASTWCMSPKVTKESFASDFIKSYYQAARDFGSQPPSAAQPLVHDEGLAERRTNFKRASPIVWSDDGESFKFAPWFRGEGFEYFIHNDMAKNRDAAGVSMGHYDASRDMVVIDMMLELKAPKGGELRLEMFKQLVFELEALGFSIGMVSFDQWQSLSIQQELTLKGYNVKQYSVDRTTEAYDTLVELILGSKIDYYYDATFIREFHELSLIEGKKVDHPEGGCFVGETRIPLLDGTFPEIKDLEGKGVWVYSARADGSIVPGKAKGFLSKFVTELVDIVLDSGAVERCTPEHRWMLRDGSYKAAKDLRPGVDRLMPIVRTWPVNGGYERVTDRNGYRELTHHMVVKGLGSVILDTDCVHHIDTNRTNNAPENLEVKDFVAHSREHTAWRHANDAAYRKKLYAGAKVFNESVEGRAAHSEALSRIMAGLSGEDYKRRARVRKSFRSDVELSNLETVRGVGTANEAATALGCGRNVVVRVLKENGFSSWADFKLAETGVNHKVRAVIPVKLQVPVPVYDLEVEEYHNFALSSGVFVHNSKDLTDAVAAVCVHCLEISKVYKAKLPGMVKMSMTSQQSGNNSVGLPYIGGVTQESTGRKGVGGPQQQRKLFFA